MCLNDAALNSQFMPTYRALMSLTEATSRVRL